MPKASTVSWAPHYSGHPQVPKAALSMEAPSLNVTVPWTALALMYNSLRPGPGGPWEAARHWHLGAQISSPDTVTMRLPQQRLSQAKKVQLLEARASPASSTCLAASWIFLSYEECSFSVSFAKSDLTVACFLVHYIFVTVQQPTVEDKAPHMCAVLHRRPRPSAVPFGSSSKPQVTGISPICQMIRLKFKIERMLAF